jgi:hypothetical protein
MRTDQRLRLDAPPPRDAALASVYAGLKHGDPFPTANLTAF